MTQDPYRPSGYDAGQYSGAHPTGTPPTGTPPAGAPYGSPSYPQAQGYPQAPYGAAPYGAPAQPAYVDAYGRPVYVAPRMPKPPGPPGLGIWSLILAVLGSVVVLVGFIWAAGQVEAAVLQKGNVEQAVIQAFVGTFSLLQTLAGAALTAGLVMGIVATATNRGRGWGIGAIVASVVGPSVAAYAGLAWIMQKAYDYTEMMQAAGI